MSTTAPASTDLAAGPMPRSNEALLELANTAAIRIHDIARDYDKNGDLGRWLNYRPTIRAEILRRMTR